MRSLRINIINPKIDITLIKILILLKLEISYIYLYYAS